MREIAGQTINAVQGSDYIRGKQKQKDFGAWLAARISEAQVHRRYRKAISAMVEKITKAFSIPKSLSE